MSVPSGISGSWDAHFIQNSAPHRMIAAQRIADHIAHHTAPGTPVVMLRDFNAAPDAPPMRYLGGDAGSPARLVNAFDTMHGAEDPRGTVRGLNGRRNGSRIDHIHINESLTVLEAEIIYDRLPTAYPSVHYPLRASFKAKTEHDTNRT